MNNSTSRRSTINKNLKSKNIPLIEIELVEWVGFNKSNDDFSLSLITGKIKLNKMEVLFVSSIDDATQF